jgi:hypothetical protein
LFALHQFIEGFVWLGLDGILPPTVAHIMGAAFILYAPGLLPFLLPLSVLLFEPTVKRRRRMGPFLVIGSLTALYILWALTAFPPHVFAEGHRIVHINPATNNTLVAVAYVIATCGSLFFSQVTDMIILGAANLVILIAVLLVKRYAFTSLWWDVHPLQLHLALGPDLRAGTGQALPRSPETDQQKLSRR